MGTEKLQEEHQQLLAENENYVHLINGQKENLSSLDRKMTDIQTRMQLKKKTMGGRIFTQKRSQQQRKHICIMEGRVSQATTKFDKLLSRNQTLRNAIDHLRRQRYTLHRIQRKLNKELQMQSIEMEELVEKSVQAYDQRSEALARMLAVRERSKKDISLCHTEMTELKRVIDHESKLRSFMVRKSQEAQLIGEDEEAKKKKGGQTQRERIGGESLETYQAVHRLLVEVAGESDLRQIGKTFEEQEQKGFAHFNYMNELNNKNIMLKESISKLKSEILRFELENKQHDNQWQSHLKRLESDLEGHRSLANALEIQHGVVLKVLDQEKTLIADLFSKLDCDPSPIAGKLAYSALVTDDNATQFIGILEERMHNLLMTLVHSKFKEAEELVLPPQNPLLLSCSLLLPMAHHTVETPSLSGPDECPADAQLGLASEVPLDFHSLRERVLRRVMQNEQGKSLRCASAPRKKKAQTFNPKSA